MKKASILEGGRVFWTAKTREVLERLTTGKILRVAAEKVEKVLEGRGFREAR